MSSTPTACSKTPIRPLPYRLVSEIEPQPPGTTWLIENLWLAGGVGLLGGQAKVCKTYLAAELALAVATGRDALGRFPTRTPGPVLFYGAEDNLAALRNRFEGLAKNRGCVFAELAVHLLEVPVLRLDRDNDLHGLRASIEACRPHLLVLDPFVRLVGGIDENSASDVSAVLGSLRAIQRELDVAILLVHHARKSPAATPYQAYRGSSDFSAWSDTNLFLTRKGKTLILNVEHRSAPSPEPIHLRLQLQPAPHLAPIDVQQNTTPSADTAPIFAELRRLLKGTARPMTTVELRERLRRRKSDVVKALEQLLADGVVCRTANGWQLSHD
jgi:hypothetical protein